MGLSPWALIKRFLGLRNALLQWRLYCFDKCIEGRLKLHHLSPHGKIQLICVPSFNGDRALCSHQNEQYHFLFRDIEVFPLHLVDSIAEIPSLKTT